MNMGTFLQAVATRSGLTPAQVRRVLDAAAIETVEALLRQDSVRWPGIGTFVPSWRAPRLVRAVRSRRQELVDGRWSVRFRPGGRVKTALADASPRHLADPDHQNAWRLADTLISDLMLYNHNKVPLVFSDPSDTAIRQACHQRWGTDWASVVSTYENNVAEPLRATMDHLVVAVRHRLGAAVPAAQHATANQVAA